MRERSHRYDMIDVGFIATQDLHDYLSKNMFAHDVTDALLLFVCSDFVLLCLSDVGAVEHGVRWRLCNLWCFLSSILQGPTRNCRLRDSGFDFVCVAVADMCCVVVYALRLFLGWMTQLPVHTEYMYSKYDFPDILHGENVRARSIFVCFV